MNVLVPIHFNVGDQVLLSARNILSGSASWRADHYVLLVLCLCCIYQLFSSFLLATGATNGCLPTALLLLLLLPHLPEQRTILSDEFSIGTDPPIRFP